MHTSGVHEVSTLSMDLSASKGRASNYQAVFHPCLALLSAGSAFLYLSWVHPPLGFSQQDLEFPHGSDGKASAYNAGDPGSIPGSGRSPGEGNGNPPQYSCLENPMDGGA